MWLKYCEFEPIPELVELFVRNATEDYITYVEIQEGRALDRKTWSSELKQILTQELEHCVQSKPSRVAVMRAEERLIGYALVKREGRTAIIEDIIAERRGSGSVLLQWLEAELRKQGVETLIADVGANNKRAQEFMQKNGYESTTMVYTKSI